MRSRSLRLSGRVFQSTLSMRRATQSLMSTINGKAISIHALHEESDR